eukprot:IDg10159t1
MKVRDAYMMMYNASQLALWSLTLSSLVAALARTGDLCAAYQTAERWARTGQALSVMEILHAGIGLAGGGVAAALVQALGRGAVLFAVLPYVHSAPCIVSTTLIAAWACGDIVRYAFYIDTLLQARRYWLLWLRYSLFLFAYQMHGTLHLISEFGIVSCSQVMPILHHTCFLICCVNVVVNSHHLPIRRDVCTTTFNKLSQAAKCLVSVCSRPKLHMPCLKKLRRCCASVHLRSLYLGADSSHNGGLTSGQRAVAQKDGHYHSMYMYSKIDASHTIVSCKKERERSVLKSSSNFVCSKKAAVGNLGEILICGALTGSSQCESNLIRHLHSISRMQLGHYATCYQIHPIRHIQVLRSAPTITALYKPPESHTICVRTLHNFCVPRPSITALHSTLLVATKDGSFYAYFFILECRCTRTTYIGMCASTSYDTHAKREYRLRGAADTSFIRCVARTRCGVQKDCRS